MRRTRAVLPSTALALALALAASTPAAAAGPTVVEMRALSYSPTRVMFPAPGRTIRWDNVTSPNRLHDALSSLPDYFASPLLGSGTSFRVRFSEAGTFTYICSIHDVMLGRVEVAPVVSVIDGPAGRRLHIQLGLTPYAPDDPFRWSVFVRGPVDTRLRHRKNTRFAVSGMPADQPGEWSVMVRLRNRLTGTPSSDSPTVTVTVPA